MYKRITIVFVFFSIAVVTLFLVSKTIPARLAIWGIRMNLDRFTVEKYQKTNLSQRVAQEELIVKKPDALIRIARTNPENNNKYVRDKTFLFQSLFTAMRSPYPEVISQQIVCPEEFKPKQKKHANGLIYTLFAGERYNFGICTKDLVSYNAVHGIFDCGAKGIFEIDGFSKSSGILAYVESFSCSR